MQSNVDLTSKLGTIIYLRYINSGRSLDVDFDVFNMKSELDIIDVHFWHLHIVTYRRQNSALYRRRED